MHFLKISDVIHAFLLAYYGTGKLSILIPLKHQSLALYPITNSFHLSVPDMTEEHNSYTQSIAFSDPQRVVLLYLKEPSSAA
jgi:hypothetical protein